MFNEWALAAGFNKSLPFQGMLGTNGRFIGPSAASDSQHLHQQQLNRNLWPATGSEYSDLYAAGGYTPAHTSSFIPTLSPLELVKSWNSAVAFSQANSSIFVQSHTDFLNCTASSASTQQSPAALQAKKTETCIGRWEQGSLIEPLQIHVPSPAISNYAIKSENPGPSHASGALVLKPSKKQRVQPKVNKNINDCILSLHQQHQNNLVTTHPSTNNNLSILTTTTTTSTKEQLQGCSRTLPLAWTQPVQTGIVQQQYQPIITSHGGSSGSNANQLTSGDGCSSAQTHTTTTTTLLQIKREPCQVSEVTTSNSLGHCTPGTNFAGSSGTLIKIEQKSPTNSNSATTLASITSTMDSAAHNNNVLANGQNNGNIPIGIAVGRQRLQEQSQIGAQLQTKDFNRFGLGLADLASAQNLSQNMFFTGTSNSAMIPLSSDLTMGLSQTRTPPTLWQYPTMEPMMPTLPPMPPVGYQLVRDPNTGQLIFLPTTTTIVTLDKMNMSCVPFQQQEPFQQQAVVWPTAYQQAAAQQLLMPPLQQSLQPPPLAPLMLQGSDYLTASTTLHQSHLQHTQTHSTRLVALTSDTKRTKCTQQTSSVPMPLPTHTLIKIEDGVSNGNHHHQQATSIYEHEKSIQTASIATAVQTTSDLSNHQSLSAQLYYQHPGLIQIAPQPPQAHQQNGCASIMEANESHHISPPPLQLTTRSASISDPQQEHMVEQTQPEVQCQDANIQTSPVMSEDDNTCGEEPNNQNEYEEESEETLQDKSSIPNSYEILCHSIAMNTSSEAEPEPTRDEENVVDSSSNVTSSMCQTESKMENHEQREPVDLSGLQLLSNSIEVFHKKTFPIKQEPMDHDMHQITSPTVASTTNSPPPVQRMYDEKSCPMTMIPALAKSEQFNPSDELGGLNLLCALAEQRFQEEVGQRHLQEQDSPTSTPEEAASGDEHARKRKHKHGAIKKSSKKSKHEKARQKERKRKHSTSGDGEVDREMEETLKRVKTKYEHWQPTTTDELFQAMNQEMKEKLATITRQCEEKRRELTQIKQVNEGAEKDSCSSSSDKNEDHKPTKISYLGNAAPLKFSIIPALSPSFSSSSNSEMMIELPKLSSDTDSGNKFEDNEASSVERSKRKFGIPKKHSDKHQEHSKKSKSLVGYILASKHHPTSSLAAATSSAYDPSKGSWTCSIDNSKKVREWKKFQKVKTEEENRSLIKESAFKDDKFSLFGETNSQKFKASSPLALPSTTHQPSSKHKHKKSSRSRSKDRKHKSEKKKLDARCVLTLESLEKDKVRVLTAMGGLFYAGCLSAITPPDVYAITLDGERGNRPHIMSREEILRDAILESAPKLKSDCPPGTRLCAYWSQQYRCLYPGVAAEITSPDALTSDKFVNVEFDDGDNGRIAIEDIRFLVSDYPIVEYDPNPLLSLNKRKQRGPSQGTSDHDQTASSHTAGETSLNREERKRLKKMRKDKMKKASTVEYMIVANGSNAVTPSSSVDTEKKHKKKHKCYDDLCKHRKHKKRRKHKKHHHREHNEDDNDRQMEHLSIVQNATQQSLSNDSNNNEDDADEFEEEESLNEENDEVSQDCVSQYEIVKKFDDPPVKEEDTMTSVLTSESSSGSVYHPKKSVEKTLSKSLENCSKIAAFLPARQLWAWQGKGFKRSTGRVKKQFYRSIQRGKETISVGDSAVFLSTGRPDRPYIGRIESMWQTTVKINMVVKVKWFYHPEETQGCPNLKYPGALFDSPHEDENDVQTISHKCEVLDLTAYAKKFGDEPSKYSAIYDNNDTYYLAGSYDPTLFQIKMEDEIPCLPANEKWA